MTAGTPHMVVIVPVNHTQAKTNRVGSIPSRGGDLNRRRGCA